MDHGILGLQENQLLEVQECQCCVTKEVGALSSVEVGIWDFFIELDRASQVCYSFLKHTETGMAPTTSYEMLCSWLLIQVYDCIQIY